MKDRYFAGPWIGRDEPRFIDLRNGGNLPDRGVVNRIVTALKTEASERAVSITCGIAVLPVAYIVWGVLTVLFMGDV